jgi:formylglycine-generating enzyme required for sulfatase activity
MKNLFFFIWLVSIISCIPKYDVVRKVDKAHKNSLPGTVWLKDSIFIDQTEVRNLDYLEYIHWLKAQDTVAYHNAFPDSLVWRTKLLYNEPYVKYYFTHPAYRDYPVVGVSYEQAVGYCKWRTDRVKEFIKISGRTIEKKYGIKNFYYRLPTKQEWEYAASAGLNSPFGFESLHTKNNWPKVNVKEAAILEYMGNSDITTPVFYCTPNKYNLYNMIGNVAEMITDKGVSKGGSWFHGLYQSEIKDSIKYEKPEAWLGFRCVCVVVK